MERGAPIGASPGTAGRPRVRLLALTAAMALVAINICTGAPVLALWLGSQAQAGGPPSFWAISIVVVSLAVFCMGLVWLLGRLNEAHERLTGHAGTVQYHAPWLRSMRAERERFVRQKVQLTALERILVIVVVLALLALEVAFFLLPASPLDPTYAVLALSA